MTTVTEQYLDHSLEAHTKRIEKKIEKEIQGLATMVATGFADIEKRIDVRERVEKLEKKMTTVETALNVRL